MLQDPLADALTAIRNAEKVGKSAITLSPASGLMGRVLEVMKAEGYIGDVARVEDDRGGLFQVSLLGRINNCGVIKPRYAVKRNDLETWEARYLPAQDFGALILTTTQGVVTQNRAKKENLGGRLLAYVY